MCVLLITRLLRLVGRWARKAVNHTSWVALVTLTDRPKSVRNRCLIELFCGVVCVVTCPFDLFVGVGAFVIGLGQISSFLSVGKPYREVCLRSELWPWMSHQPNSWSKHTGTRIEQVLAYCREEQKYVGLGLLFCLTVTMTFGVRVWKFIGLMEEILPIHQLSFTEIRSKIREK